MVHVERAKRAKRANLYVFPSIMLIFKQFVNFFSIAVAIGYLIHLCFKLPFLFSHKDA